MSFESFYNRFILNGEIAEVTGFNPFYHELQSSLDDKLIIDGEEFINLASNNYLGLANDERIKEASIKAIEKYGISLCATPIAAGYSDLYKRVEKKISSFVNLEDTLIYPSCYQANTGLFSIIAGKEDIVIVDQYAHSSLLQGIKAVGCKIRPFLHNDMENLERMLKKSIGFRQVFVVTESVFSTEGSIAPFKKIVKLCEQFNALPIIDDSHGIGVIGENGKGILENENIENFQGIYTASLGKALANLGGAICGRKDIIDYLRYYSSHLVYSTAITPSILAGIDKVIEIIEREFKTISKVMWDYKNKISHALLQGGFEIADAKSPINSITAGTPEETFLLAKKLFEHKIFATPFIYPSVPYNKGKIRLIAGANLKEKTIERAVEKLNEIKN